LAHIEHVAEEKQKTREDKKESVSSYRMTFRRRKDTGTWKGKHKIAL
jgi:hypothetical protein